MFGGELLDEHLTVELLCLIHKCLFDGVRPHCGKHRRPDYGDEYLVFGPNRSAPRDAVPGELDRVLGEARRAIASFDKDLDNPKYEELALRLAAWVHAELIRVHPFEDGNGRTCRLMMNWLLLRLGLRPVAIEVPKHEYMSCLNHYYRAGDIRPLEALLLRLYPLS